MRFFQKVYAFFTIDLKDYIKLRDKIREFIEKLSTKNKDDL